MLAVLVLAGAASLVVLHRPRVQRAVFAHLATRALASAGVSIEASDFRFNLLLGTVEIRDGIIRSASATDLPPLATIGSASLDFNPLSLLRGLSAFRDIRVRNLATQVVVARDGRTNLPKAQSSTPFDLRSLPSRIAIEEASLRYEDTPRGLQVVLPRLRLALSENNGSRDLSLAALAPGRLEFEKRLLSVDEIQLSGKLVSSDLEVQSLTAKLPGIMAQVRGSIRNLQEPSFELSLKSTVAPGGLWKFLGGQDPLDGTVNVDAFLAGPLGRLTAEVVLGAKDVRLGGMDPWTGGSTLRYDQAASVLALAGLSASSPIGALTASGSISLREKQGKSALNINAREVDPYRLMTWFGWSPAIAGRASGTARLTWDGIDWRAAGLVLDLNVTPVESAKAVRSIPLGGSLKLERDPRSLTLRLAGIQGSGFHLDGNLRFDRVAGRLQGAFAGEVSDGAALLGGIRRAWPSEMAELDLPLDGSLRWSAQVAGPLTGPRVIAKVESASLKIGRVTDIGLGGTVEYRAGLWRFADIDVSWQGQRGWLNGEIDTSPAGSPSLGFEAGFDDASLPALVTPLDLKIPVAGRLSGHLTAQGTFAAPVAEGTLKCEDIRVLEESFGTLAAGFRLHGSELTVEPVRLEKPQQTGQGTLEASGSLDWKRDSFSFRVTGAGLKLDSMALPDGTNIRGIISLDAEGESSLSEPTWKAHFSGAQVSVAERNVGAIRGSLAAQGGLAQVSVEVPDLPATLLGQIGLTHPYEIAVRAESAGIDFNRLGLPAIRDIPVEGSAAGRIDVAGPLARPNELTAKGLVRDLVIRFAEHEIRGAQPAELGWEEGRLTVIPTRLASGDGTLEIGGSIPLSGSGTGEGLSIEGTLPFTLLPHLVPGLRETEAKGTVQVRGSLRGSLADLAPSAEIAGSDGELRIPELKTPLTHIVSGRPHQPGGCRVETAGGRSGRWHYQRARYHPVFRRCQRKAPPALWLPEWSSRTSIPGPWLISRETSPGASASRPKWKLDARSYA